MQISSRWTVILSASFLLAATAYAGSRIRPAFDHSLKTASDVSALQRLRSGQAFPETLHVLAAMVEFKTDKDSRTTGNGQFDLSASTPGMIDPPPHNRTYFQNHLTFVENYFRRVSDGKLVIQGTVLDSVYTLPNQMPHYSPPRTSPDNLELGYLMNDAWHAVDSVTPGIPFHNYQAFVIFHAGIGRDVDLASCTGYDPTPFDIPSIYLNLASLRKMFGPSYGGVIVNGGADTVRSSMIIPETETRDNPCTFPQSVLQLGINGLLAASVGSHLGLPDLFDTKTGASGIGRFGLMDGQSIFSWSGIFPPEPSAWEKYFLGWLDPITIASGDSLYNFPAVSLTTSEDTVCRVLISEKEYFLVENRCRDANNDGATVSVVRNGVTSTMTWLRDTVGFNGYSPDSLYGVVLNVDDFDWSLPGGYTEWFDGGILIWHIDENVIDANIALNTVNADPDHRGVNLMEADGSQDIGQSYSLLEAGYGSEVGTPLDFWYAGNIAPLRVRSNAFTPTSSPSSMSNSRANSHVTIKSFSPNGPRMTARIQVGDDVIKPVAGFPKFTGQQFGTNSLTIDNDAEGLARRITVNTEKFGVVPAAKSPELMAVQQVGQSKIYSWNINGSPALSGGDSSGEILSAVGAYGSFTGKIAVGAFGPDTEFAVGGIETNVISPSTGQGVGIAGMWNLKDQNHDQRIDSSFKTDLSKFVTTSPVISDSFIAFGAKGGFVYLLRYDGSIAESLQIPQADTSDIVSLSLFHDPSSYVAVTSNGYAAMWGLACPLSPSVIVPGGSRIRPSQAIAGTISARYGREIVLVSRDGQVSLVSPCSFSPLTGFPVSTGGEILGSPILADINGDGQRDIVVFSGNRIFAINATGAILDNFPVTVPTGTSILTSPIAADINGDGAIDIIAVTQEGLVVAYDGTGRMLRGFPLLTGVNSGSTPAAFYLPSSCLSCTDIGLAVASDDGHVYAWRTGTLKTGLTVPPSMPWPQAMHDARNSGLVDSLLPIIVPTSEFFPRSRAYNWPNPVDAAHGYKTHIRYYVRDDSKVHIKIFDLAGEAVTEFDGPGQGGLDNEIEWNVGNIQSGVYFAHIEAQGTSGHGVAIIKIAVIK
ncbi:MAG: FG-GAP-like repeat-containing protein [Bacteroidota bacterium]